jgi:hypothetical protein
MGVKLPFSIVIPEGGKHVTAHRTLFGALADARKCNVSRASRDLPLVTVLDRGTGRIYEVPPDADILAIEAGAL